MIIYMAWFTFITGLAGVGINIERIGNPKPVGLYGKADTIIGLILVIIWGIALYFHYVD